jgi:hypothetical protein
VNQFKLVKELSQLPDSPLKKKLTKAFSLYGSPKLQSKHYTLAEVANFFDGVLRKKVQVDACYGLDPERKSTIEAFTFQEFMLLA